MPKKPTSNKTSSKLSSKDIITIMKQAAKLNVSSINIEGLSITYNSNNQSVSEKPQTTKRVSMKIPDSTEDAVAEESEEELRELIDILSEQTNDLMDPRGYEDSIFSRQKAQEEPQTEVVDA